MAYSWPLLSIITFLPLLGAAVILLLIRGNSEFSYTNARSVALFVSIVVFLVSLLLWVNFDYASYGFQFVEEHAWLPTLHMTYKVGIDGISLFFVLLSTFLVPICILASWKSIQKNVKEYMIAFLVLESVMIGTFVSLNIILFYIFFEAVLIPMYIIVGIWGGPNRIYASFKFFLYTLLGSLFMLLAILAMYGYAHTMDITVLLHTHFPISMQYWLWLAFFASFAVKVPMFPVHTWLPDTHVEAPTAGSVILAGVLLKMGGYGFLRFSLPMLPDASSYFADFVFVLSVIAVIYTSLIAIVQKDMKKMIAYSSIAHMGFVTAAIFAVNDQAITGAIVQMLSHGIVSGALFLCVGVIYDRLHTREIDAYGGLAKNMPKYAFFFMVFMMASVGLPGTSGFVGEFLILVGSFQVNTYLALGLATGMVLGPAYMLFLYRKVVFGDLIKDTVKALKDVCCREVLYLSPLIVLVFWMGIYPQTFIRPIDASVKHLVLNYNSRIKEDLADDVEDTSATVPDDVNNNQVQDSNVALQKSEENDLSSSVHHVKDETMDKKESVASSVNTQKSLKEDHSNMISQTK